MEVIANDPFPAEGSGIDYVSREELFRRSDIISLHCPLTEDTRYIINEHALSLMKPDTLIVNTSRGKLIDSEAAAERAQRKADRRRGSRCLRGGDRAVFRGQLRPDSHRRNAVAACIAAERAYNLAPGVPDAGSAPQHCRNDPPESRRLFRRAGAEM